MQWECGNKMPKMLILIVARTKLHPSEFNITDLYNSEVLTMLHNQSSIQVQSDVLLLQLLWPNSWHWHLFPELKFLCNELGPLFVFQCGWESCFLCWEWSPYLLMPLHIWRDFSCKSFFFSLGNVKYNSNLLFIAPKM